MELTDYYSLKDSAALIGVSRMTLYRWIKAGKVKPVAAWGRAYLSLDQISKLVKVCSCSNCFHKNDAYCSCRLPEDVKPRKCSDWCFINGIK